MLHPCWPCSYFNSPVCVLICTSRQDEAFEQDLCHVDYSKVLVYASIGIWVTYLSDEILKKWSWIIIGNDPDKLEWAIDSQNNSIEQSRGLLLWLLLYMKARRIYSKVHQGKSNALLTVKMKDYKRNSKACQLLAMSCDGMGVILVKKAKMEDLRACNTFMVCRTWKVMYAPGSAFWSYSAFRRVTYLHSMVPVQGTEPMPGPVPISSQICGSFSTTFRDPGWYQGMCSYLCVHFFKIPTNNYTPDLFQLMPFILWQLCQRLSLCSFCYLLYIYPAGEPFIFELLQTLFWGKSQELSFLRLHQISLFGIFVYTIPKHMLINDVFTDNTYILDLDSQCTDFINKYALRLLMGTPLASLCDLNLIWISQHRFKAGLHCQ